MGKTSRALEAMLAALPSPKSRRGYRVDWDRYREWCRDEGVKVRKARPRDIMQHLAYLQANNYAKTTISRALSVIREVYAAFVRHELMEANPAREVKGPRTGGAPKTPWLDEMSMAAVLNLPATTWEEKRDRVAAFLLFGLGWRRSEIARLRLEERLDDEFPFSTLRLSDGTCHGIVKGAKEGTVGVPDWVLAEVTQWCEFAGLTSRSAILPRWSDDPRPISDGVLYKRVKLLARRAGLDPAKVAPHGFRRSHITIAAQKGVNLRKLQGGVLHASLNTTERYVKANEAASNAPGNVFAGMIRTQGEIQP